MTNPLDFCATGFDPNQFLSVLEGVRGRINQKMGQFSSQISALSSLLQYSNGWSGSLSLMDALGDVFDKCPGLKDFYNCMLPMLNELEFGANAGVTTGITGPCFNLQLQQLIDINLPCMVKSAMNYADMTGDDPIEVLTEQSLVIREMFAPTNLRYTRVDSHVKLVWDDDLNTPSPIIYEISLLSTPITMVLDTKEAEIHGLPHGFPQTLSIVAKDPTGRFASPPATIEVIAFEHFDLNVTSLTVVSASEDQVLLSWDPIDHYEIVGYVVRWETTFLGVTRQNVYYVGDRNQVMLVDMIPMGTTISVHGVTYWFETTGTSVLVEATPFNIISAIFDSGAPYPPGATGTLTLTFPGEVSAPGVWNTASLENGVPGAEIFIPPSDFDKLSPNVMVITFTMPNPAYVPVHNLLRFKINNLLGDSVINSTESLP